MIYVMITNPYEICSFQIQLYLFLDKLARDYFIFCSRLKNSFFMSITFFANSWFFFFITIVAKENNSVGSNAGFIISIRCEKVFFIFCGIIEGNKMEDLERKISPFFLCFLFFLPNL